MKIIIFILYFIPTMAMGNFLTQDRIETEEKFNQVLNYLSDKTSSWIESHGARLKIEGLWLEQKPNASAGQNYGYNGRVWSVSINGGLARNKAVTTDGFVMVFCHELGHHLGGFPFFNDTVIAGMAVEGEADYYSASCVKNIWREEHTLNSQSIHFVSNKDMETCDVQRSDILDRELCYRVMNAIRSREALYKYYEDQSPGRFDGPVGPDVGTTLELHPDHKCRIKTMEAANLCSVERPPAIIPGKSERYSAISREAKLSAAEFSCTRAQGYTIGVRPKCWFAPSLKTLAGVKEVKLKEVDGNMNNIPEAGEIFEAVATVKNYSNFDLLTGEVQLAENKPSYQIIEKSINSLSGLPTSNSFDTSGSKIKISPTLRCGDRIQLRYQISEANKLEYQVKSKRLGSIQKNKKIFSNNKRTNIPDINSFGRYGNSSIRVFGLDDVFDKVYVKLDIGHSNRADLMATLISPAGKRYVIFQKRGLESRDLSPTFSINLPHLEGNGSWKIEIRDLIQRNKGFLKSWQIQFAKYICK
jgi:subtilisin-like proprotein convertase family protein